jgi:hypothetical protein
LRGRVGAAPGVALRPSGSRATGRGGLCPSPCFAGASTPRTARESRSPVLPATFAVASGPRRRHHGPPSPREVP